MKFIQIALLAICSFLFVTCTHNVVGNSSKNEVTDIDGNVYQTVTIGAQVWMAENLKTTRFNDGSPIPLVTDSTTWANLTTPAYCWYNNDSATFGKTYGALYNWFVVNTGKLAPTGWHVPSDSEWGVMQNYLVINGYNYDGTTDTSNNKIAIALAAQTDWYSFTGAGYPGNNLTKNNGSGFSALPGGRRSSNGTFSNQGFCGYWWTATEYNASVAWYRFLYYDLANLYRNFNFSKIFGFSVRLVRD